MSNVPPVPAAPTASAAPKRNEVTIVSHSNLFYWWPVWAVGFLMTILTALDNEYMVTVPNESFLAHSQKVVYYDKVETIDGKTVYKEPVERVDRDVVVLPEGKKFDTKRYPELLEKATPKPKLHISPRRSYGVIFAFVLLMIILITNVPLRGVWSVLVIVGSVTIILILNLAGVWDHIVRSLSLLDIRINMGGYLFLSTALFILWLLTFALFDQRIYVRVAPGAVQLRTEIGGAIRDEPGARVTFNKQPSDFFRHTILGFGAGDLVVKIGDEKIELHNVLFATRKAQQAQLLVREVRMTSDKA